MRCSGLDHQHLQSLLPCNHQGLLSALESSQGLTDEETEALGEEGLAQSRMLGEEVMGKCSPAVLDFSLPAERLPWQGTAVPSRELKVGQDG